MEEGKYTRLDVGIRNLHLPLRMVLTSVVLRVGFPGKVYLSYLPVLLLAVTPQWDVAHWGTKLWFFHPRKRICSNRRPVEGILISRCMEREFLPWRTKLFHSLKINKFNSIFISKPFMVSRSNKIISLKCPRNSWDTNHRPWIMIPCRE